MVVCHCAIGVDGEAIREVGGVDEEAIGGARDDQLAAVEGDGASIQAGGEADDFALGIGGAGEFVTQGGFVAYSHFRASFDRADGGWAGEGEAALVGAGGVRQVGADSGRASERMHRLGWSAVIAEGGEEGVLIAEIITDFSHGARVILQIWITGCGVPRENSIAEVEARAATISSAAAGDAAAISVSRIAGEGALAQAQARAALEAAVDDAAARVRSRIAGEGALAQAQARAAIIGAVAEDATTRGSRIAGEGASVEGELDGVVAATSIGINGTS